MGNQLSSAGEGGTASGSTTSRQVRGFMRTTGLLGLSKTDLDERCKPSGLYPSCQWEDKAVRKLIGDGKIAARLRGMEHRQSATDRECPICFLQYREVNVTKCCSAHICTECYLQVRPQKAKSPSCPFCNHSKMTVSVAQAMNAGDMLAREETEQRVIEAKIRERASSDTSSNRGGAGGGGGGGSEHLSACGGFGSSLEQHERIASLRARSSSLSDHDNYESIPEEVLRSSFAITPEERRTLEDEMRAQHSHPLTLRLEAEAEERRLRNEQEFLRNNPNHYVDSRGRSRRSRASQGEPRRNWNQIVEAFERGGHGEVNSLDDLVVLEAAMILSMEEESRRRAAGNADGEGDEGFDANRHANEGFPLVRSILSGRQPGDDTNEQIQSLANSLYSRRRGRSSLLRATAAADNSLDTALDTAGLLMRGLSEEDQLAMAIAASLQDQQQPPQQGQEQEQQGENSGDQGAVEDIGDGDNVTTENIRDSIENGQESAQENNAWVGSEEEEGSTNTESGQEHLDGNVGDSNNRDTAATDDTPGTQDETRPVDTVATACETGDPAPRAADVSTEADASNEAGDSVAVENNGGEGN